MRRGAVQIPMLGCYRHVMQGTSIQAYCKKFSVVKTFESKLKTLAFVYC
ncbi:hypothetical protein O9992_12795 [Vibrio lentus]|nr:hypothetical protein [Vibrio lentus]